jgi:regulator of RNase E activity RraA
VEIGGLRIQSGELLHGDRHGFQSIPVEIAAEIPAAAARLAKREQALIALCRASDFSLEKLRGAIAASPR